MKGIRHDEVSRLAEYCRTANMGYRDGQPATHADIQERVRLLEKNCRSYAKSLLNLHRKLDEK